MDEFGEGCANFAQHLITLSFLNYPLDSDIEPVAIFRSEVLGREHDHRNIPPVGSLMHLLDELEAIHFGHHEIENNGVRPDFGQACQRNSTVLCLGYNPPVLLELGSHSTASDLIIINYK
jgi:hypothetical protein